MRPRSYSMGLRNKKTYANANANIGQYGSSPGHRAYCYAGLP